MWPKSPDPALVYAHGVDFINAIVVFQGKVTINWYQILIENNSLLTCYTFVATNDSDYSGLPVVISFSAGHPLNTPICANITIIDDNTLENTETFSVALYTDFPEGILLTRDRSVVEIFDNEEGN